MDQFICVAYSGFGPGDHSGSYLLCRDKEDQLGEHLFSGIWEELSGYLSFVGTLAGHFSVNMGKTRVEFLQLDQQCFLSAFISRGFWNAGFCAEFYDALLAGWVYNGQKEDLY